MLCGMYWDEAVATHALGMVRVSRSRRPNVNCSLGGLTPVVGCIARPTLVATGGDQLHHQEVPHAPPDSGRIPPESAQRAWKFLSFPSAPARPLRQGSAWTGSGTLPQGRLCLLVTLAGPLGAQPGDSYRHVAGSIEPLRRCRFHDPSTAPRAHGRGGVTPRLRRPARPEPGLRSAFRPIPSRARRRP